MVNMKTLTGQLCAAPKQRKTPRRELERQVKVLLDSINAKSEHGNVQKGLIGDCHTRLPEKRANFEFDFVKAAPHACTFGDGMFEMPVRGAFPLGDDARIRIQEAQSDGQTSGGHAARHIDRMDRNPARVVLIFRASHCLLSFCLACAVLLAKPLMGRATMQRARSTAGRG